jgi:hypothetical protein
VAAYRGSHTRRCALVGNVFYFVTPFAYLQIADHSGRKVPTTGEINYRSVLEPTYRKRTRHEPSPARRHSRYEESR